MSLRKDGLSRREMAAALVTAAPLVAQQTAAPTEDADVQAREGIKRTRDQLRKIKIPIATEPSFIFRP
jgi:hypothetical protein